MSIPPRFLDDIRSRLSLSDVIGKRIKVTRAGREFKACCPFHSEKTPSFTINDAKQFYHCFGCGAHGDVIGFTMQYENVSFIDAVESLAAQAGLQMPEQTPQDIQKAKEQKDLFALMEDATTFFQEQLWNNKDNAAILNYVRDRGLSDTTMNDFRVGYAPADRFALGKHLVGKGYTLEQMVDAGVIKKSTKGGEPYAFFRERVMFPVSDLRGRVVAYGGRILPDHLLAPSSGDFTPPKYINSGDTPIFHKGSLLYAAALARSAAGESEENPIIVVEGYMDVIACHQGGFKGAVAPMGTALTEPQIMALWKMVSSEVKEPVLCFDGDNAGRRAARRAAERILPLLGANKSVKIAFLPDGQDPDTLIKDSGASAFKTILKNAMPLVEFIWNYHVGGKVTDTPEKRAGVIEAVKNDVFVIADKTVQSHYNRIIQDKISAHFFSRNKRGGSYGVAKHNRGRGVGSMVKLRSPKAAGNAKQNLVSRILMATLLNHPQIFDDVEEEFGAMVCPDSDVERLKHEALSFLGQHDEEILIAENDQKRLIFHTHLRAQGYEKLMDDILSPSVYTHAGFCAPHAPPETIAAQWLAFWRESKSGILQKEMHQGWKKAYENDDLEQEERLKTMLYSEAGTQD